MRNIRFIRLLGAQISQVEECCSLAAGYVTHINRVDVFRDIKIRVKRAKKRLKVFISVFFCGIKWSRTTRRSGAGRWLWWRYGHIRGACEKLQRVLGIVKGIVIVAASACRVARTRRHSGGMVPMGRHRCLRVQVRSLYSHLCALYWLLRHGTFRQQSRCAAQEMLKIKRSLFVL
jgi:hypothetical protein